MLELHHAVQKSGYNDYYVDVEYNRNAGKLKTIINNDFCITNITCDLIVHSRGENIKQDNLIAIEMKKHTATREEKQNDINRLIALTKDSYDDVWSYDGKTLPEHVCGYIIGIYYEINIRLRKIIIKYYSEGVQVANNIISF